MQVDLYSASGEKTGTLSLPAAMFEAPINRGLMHLALVRQLSNKRSPIAHVKHRGEVVGTTKKAYQQKHTGRARRGALRSPLLRGGGKAFGPRNEANFTKEMPKKMRRAALFSCLSYRAKKGDIIALQEFSAPAPKTKVFASLLSKLPVVSGRKIVIVTADKHDVLERSARNIPGVRVLRAAYLNPVDLLSARSIVFLADAVQKAEALFLSAGSAATPSTIDTPAVATAPETSKPRTKKAAPKKPATATSKKKASSKASA